MKKLTQFQCEICHTIYNNEKDAKLCEENHKSIVAVVRTKNQPRTIDASGYPQSIEVQMSDGKFVVYHR